MQFHVNNPVRTQTHHAFKLLLRTSKRVESTTTLEQQKYEPVKESWSNTSWPCFLFPLVVVLAVGSPPSSLASNIMNVLLLQKAWYLDFIFSARAVLLFRLQRLKVLVVLAREFQLSSLVLLQEVLLVQFLNLA